MCLCFRSTDDTLVARSNANRCGNLTSCCYLSFMANIYIAIKWVIKCFLSEDTVRITHSIIIFIAAHCKYPQAKTFGKIAVINNKIKITKAWEMA